MTAKPIKWIEGDIYDNFTFRSSLTKQCRTAIQQQPRYQTHKHAYLIENNPFNLDFQYSEQELHKMEIFFNNNNECNPIPFIRLAENKWRPLNNVLTNREIKSTTGNIPTILIGQQETYSKLPIPKGTILGQYIGYESIKNEWDNMYKGIKISKLKYRMQYLCHNTIPFTNNEPVQIVIDPFDHKTTPINLLHQINDCRSNISSNDMTQDDKHRQNCEFVSVLVNGWSSVLIRTTKTILPYKSLWIHYGNYYGLLFANKSLVINTRADVMMNQKKKKKKKILKKKKNQKLKIKNKK
eukprot:516436_1